MKGYTDFFAGFLGASAVATKPIGETKYMDWERAHKIIEERAKKNKSITVEAGLMEDWNNTSGIVYIDGRFVRAPFVFARSSWATPILDIDGEEIECYTTTKPDGFTECTPTWWSKESKKR